MNGQLQQKRSVTTVHYELSTDAFPDACTNKNEQVSNKIRSSWFSLDEADPSRELNRL